MESTRRSGFPGDAVLKNLTAHAEATGDMGLIPWLGRSPGGGNGSLLQCSFLEHPMDRGTWQATVHGVARVRHDLVSKSPPNCARWRDLSFFNV